MDLKDHSVNELFAFLFQAHPWHGVPAGKDSPGVVNAYIEMVPTDAVKYELDKVTGHLRLDRPQQFSSRCPTLYGFIPRTYCGEQVAEYCMNHTGLKGVKGDGDPLDICVLTEKSVAHGIFVRAVPIGGLRMIDREEADDKIIAVLESDITYGHIGDISQCQKGLVDRLQHYFLSYKQLPGPEPRKVEIAAVYDHVEALEVIQRSIVGYKISFGEPDARLAELTRKLKERQG